MMKLSEVMAESPPPQESDAGGGLKLSEVTKLSDIQAPAQAPAQSGGGLTFDSAPVVPDIAGSSGVSVTPDLAATSPLVGGINEQKTDFGRSSNTGTTNDRIRNLITGDHLKTEFTESLPQIQFAPELSKVNKQAFLSNLGTVLTRDQNALEGVIKKQFGDDASFSEDEKGNIFATLPSGTYQLNHPSFDLADAGSFAIEGALVTGGAIKDGVVRAAGKTALGQSAIEAAEKVVGGNFDPLNIALASIGGAIGGKIDSARAAKGGVAPAQQTAEERRLVAQIVRKTKPEGEAETFLLKIGNDTPPPPDIKDIDPDAVKNLDDLLIDDETTATFVVDGSGRLKSSAAGRAAISNGHNPAVVASMLGADKQTKKIGEQMMNIQQRSLADGKFAGDNRPTKPIGELMQTRIETAVGVRRQAGRRIQAAALKLQNTPVDLDATKATFLDSITREHGVKLTADGLDFSESSFQTAILKPSQARIQTVYDKLFVTGIRNGADAHRFKGALDDLIPNKKLPESGVSAKLESIMINTRQELNTSIRKVSTEYAGANDRAAPAIEALDGLQKAVGKSIDFDSPSAAESLGTAARGLLSNNKSRGALADSLMGVEAVARREGKDTGGDITTLIKLANHLESVFGTNADNSLGGIIENTNKLNERRRQLSANPAKAAIEITQEKVTDYVGEKLGKSDLDQIRLLRNVIREGR